MCGIAGFVSGPVADPAAVLERMLATMATRGPDDRGTWFDHRVGLGHLRLSIIDLSARGHQPFVTADGQGVLSYNGEVYNFRELRAELAREGVSFVSATDTEVVLYALHHWGPEAAIGRLQGMFAFAYYDLRDRRLWLARDRMGIKPLFVARQGGCLAFASEQKALFAHPQIRCELDQHALIDVILFERFDGEMTPYRHVENVEPGTLTCIADGTERKITFYDVLRDLAVARIVDNGHHPYEQHRSAIAQALESSVRSHLVSDASLATMCSGGVDSGLVTALVKTEKPDVVGYVADVEGLQGEEVRRARLVADHLGIELRPVRVDAAQFDRLFPAAVFANDQPPYFAQDIAAMRVAEVMRDDGFKVVLTGDGADEVFGGYGWHERAWRAWRRRRLHRRWIRPNALTRRLGRLHDFFRPRDLERLAEDPFGSARSGLGPMNVQLVDGARRQLRSARLFQKLEPLPRHEDRAYLAYGMEDIYVHLRERLGSVDRMSMACSIECRVPFLDNDLVDAGLHLPPSAKYHRGIRKRVLKDLARERLPAGIIDIRKIGFGMAPRLWRGTSEFLHKGLVAELLKWREQDQPDILRLIERKSHLHFRLLATECLLRMRLCGESPEEIGARLQALRAASAGRS